MHQTKGRLSILHVILAIRETSAPYNEHCLPWSEKRDITICTYFRSDLNPLKTIRVYEGDGSLRGFLRKLKSALNEREYDVIHVHSPHLGLLFLLATLFSSRKIRLSTVITVHDSFQNFKLRNQLMFLPVFAGFQRVVCCSRSSYESFPALYKHLAGKRLCYVQNGLDLDRVDRIAANTRRTPAPTDGFTVVAISRLVDIKNPFAVLDAFQMGGDQASRLVYIGDGYLRQSLAARTQERHLEQQVTFTGLIPREKVFEHLLKADLFVSASRGEGLPVSVLEAMACGRPVILSDIPPHREIAEGVDFIPLVDPDDTAGFAREIQRFRKMSSKERTRLGRECRKLVEERFSLTAMHAGYREVYSQITGTQGSWVLETTV